MVVWWAEGDICQHKFKLNARNNGWMKKEIQKFRRNSVISQILHWLDKNPQLWPQDIYYLIYTKGGLISESFSFWLKSPKMGAKSRSWASSLFVDSPQGCSLVPIFGDLSQSEKLSEIKPPLLQLISFFKLQRCNDFALIIRYAVFFFSHH